jgi:hypothetical protein
MDMSVALLYLEPFTRSFLTFFPSLSSEWEMTLTTFSTRFLPEHLFSWNTFTSWFTFEHFYAPVLPSGLVCDDA